MLTAFFNKFGLFFLSITMLYITGCNGQKSDTSSIEIAHSSANDENTASLEETESDDNMSEINIAIDNQVFSAKLYDNETSTELIKMLPITIDMSELNGNEKYYYLDSSLPTASSKMSNIHTGDIMLYGSSCLVLFYEDFSTSYSYTPLGFIEDTTGLTDALGSGDVQITLTAN